MDDDGITDQSIITNHHYQSLSLFDRIPPKVALWVLMDEWVDWRRRRVSVSREVSKSWYHHYHYYYYYYYCHDTTIRPPQLFEDSTKPWRESYTTWGGGKD